MDDRTQELAAEAAYQLLQSFRGSHPQWTDDRTPLDKLTSWLGLEIATFHPEDYPKGTYGFLEPEENLIWLCRDLSETLRRFTLAHELGHAVLHRQVSHEHIAFNHLQPVLEPEQGMSREDPCQTYDVREEVTGLIYQEQAEELLGIGLSYDPRSHRELAANIFAAELLMPFERVRALYLTGEVPANKLASVFGVSNAAMLNRLAGLLREKREIAGQVELGGPVPGQPLAGRGQAPPLQYTFKESVPSEDGEEVQPEYGRDDPRGRLQPDPGAEATLPQKQYDEFQRAAIEAPTPALIVAGPGSGKTSTLIGRAEYLIDTLGIALENILALTFSRKAAEEMQERLGRVLGAHTALPTVSTFHAFCAELLRTYGSLVGLRQDFAFVDDAEGYFLLLRLAAELPLRHYQNLNTPTYYFPALLSAISRAKDELVTPVEYRRLALRMLERASNEEEIEKAERALEIADVYALYQAALERQGDTDFGGLIMLTVQLLQEHPEVSRELQQKYQHILVDEFQDINRASGVLLRELAGDARRVWVVGDANQAIYGFRGASPANIANFRDDYPDAVVLPLSRNYRSRPDIVRFADVFRRDHLEHLESDSVQGSVQTARTTSEDAYVTLAIAPDEASELNGLINDIWRKQAEGYHFCDIVVLCRTRAQARKITQALVDADLPVIERGGLLEQEHIKNLLSIVMLLAEPSGMGILRAARQGDHPFTQSDIEALLQAAREQKVSPITLILRDEAPPTMSIEGGRSLRCLSVVLKALHLAQNVWSLLADYLFIETSLVRELLSPGENAQARAILADYSGLLQLARYYDQQQQMLRFQNEQEAFARGEDGALTALPPIQEQTKGFLDYLSVLLSLRHDGGKRQEEGAEGNDGETPDVIRVMTVHASKGLEFPVVYLPGIVKQRFPMQKRSNPVEPPMGMLPAESEGDAAHETGEACLFYVGATRARDHLVLSYAERYGKKNYKRSAYIDALVAGLPEERITRVVWQDNQAGQAAEAEDGRVGDGDRAGLAPARPPAARPPSPALTRSPSPAWPPATQPSSSAWFEPVSSQPSGHFVEAMKPKTLTISALETYQRCPRQYMYGTIYGFHGEDAAYRLFWKATQDALEALKHTLETNREGEERDAQSPTLEETQALYTHYWRELGGHTVPFAALYERHGHEVTELIRRELLANGDTRWQLRQNFTVDIAGRTIEVSVDRVETPAQDDEPVKFVRTRFGKRKEKPTPTARELLYARASRQHHPEQNIELLIHNMSTGESFQIKLTEKKEQALYNELEQAILGLEGNEFPPKPDMYVCPSCPFFLICPA
jgi:DNA helicase II / ATP-dependent DNA helicase PcrA